MKKLHARRAISFLLIAFMLLGAGGVALAVESPAAIGASLILSADTNDENYVTIESFGGKACYLLESSEKLIPVRADSVAVSSTDKNVAIKITYFDKGTDFISVHYNNGKLTAAGEPNPERVLIAKNATDTWKTSVIIVNDASFSGALEHSADFYIGSYESELTGATEYIAEIGVFAMDKLVADGEKQYAMHAEEALMLKKLGLADLTAEPLRAVSAEEANALISTISGTDAGLLGDELTLEELLRGFLKVFGKENTASSGLVSECRIQELMFGIGKKANWFGMDMYPMQNMGMCTQECSDISRIACRDDLAGIAYYLLLAKKDSQSFLVKLANEKEGFLKLLFDSGERHLLYPYYSEAGIKIQEKQLTDSETGKSITAFYLPGSNINPPYLNQLCSADGRYYLLCAAYDIQRGVGMPVIYDSKEKKTFELAKNHARRWYMDNYAMVLSPQNVIYYILDYNYSEAGEIWSYNINTGEEKLIYTETVGELYEIPTVTNDGRYLSFTRGVKSELNPEGSSSYPNEILVLNLETGSAEEAVSYEWTDAQFAGKINPFIGHVIINPENPKVLNYLHGGGDNVGDRMWLVDTETGNKWQPYVQDAIGTNSYGENLTHWVWSNDGTKLYMVRPSKSSLSVTNGFSYYDMKDAKEQVTNGDLHVVNGDFAYVHTAPNTADTHFISDSLLEYDRGRYRSEIILCDMENNISRLLAYVPIRKYHPGHPHPTFSYDGNKIIFSFSDEKTELMQLGVMDVTDEIADMRQKGNYRHGNVSRVKFGKLSGEGIRMSYVSDAESPQEAEVSGVKCHMVSGDAKFCLNVSGEYIKPQDKKVLIRLNYLDEGNEPFKLLYNTDSESHVRATKNAKPIEIEMTDSGKWVTKTVILEDASFRSAGDYNSDFILMPPAEGTLYVKNVSAAAISEELLCRGEESYYVKQNESFAQIAELQTGHLKLEIPVYYYGEKTKENVMVSAAVYDENKKLKKVSVAYKDVLPMTDGQTAEVEIDYQTGDMIKSFVWYDVCPAALMP